jgi:hypothetical protein
MADKINTAGDPNIQAGLGHLLTMFDPKAAAEGSALQARTRNFDAETGLHNAKTGALNDRRKFLADDAALAAAGYTPRQILAFRMTGAENGVADLFNGVRTDTGTQMVIAPGGDKRTGGILLNVPATLEADAAFTPEEAEKIRREKAAADLAKATATANITQQGVNSRAANKAKATAAEGDKNERYAFTPEQVNGPVRQAIVDLYSAGTKDKDFTTLDEGTIRNIIDTQQTLIATGLSTRSSSLSDALAALGYVGSGEADARMDVTHKVEQNTFTPNVKTVVGVKPKETPKIELGEVESRISRGEVPAEAYAPGTFKPSDIPMEIPLERARDMLPQIRDQAELGSMFKIGNRIYEKVQMQDGSFALKAVR